MTTTGGKRIKHKHITKIIYERYRNYILAEVPSRPKVKWRKYKHHNVTLVRLAVHVDSTTLICVLVQLTLIDCVNRNKPNTAAGTTNHRMKSRNLSRQDEIRHLR